MCEVCGIQCIDGEISLGYAHVSRELRTVCWAVAAVCFRLTDRVKYYDVDVGKPCACKSSIDRDRKQYAPRTTVDGCNVPGLDEGVVGVKTNVGGR